jgi:Lon protease-like protein
MNELIPIFPLEIVVFPGDELNLHIFEPRYQELINDCTKTKKPFGIPTVLDRKIAGLGTVVQLIEIANVQADGQMDIRTQALRRFRIRQLLKEYPGKLYSAATVDYLETKEVTDPKGMRAVFEGIKKLHALLNVTKKFPKPEAELTTYDVAHQAGLSLKQEYDLLELDDETERQKYLQRHLNQVLPVVAEMESLKDKIKLNGHFKKLPGFDLL